LLFEKNGLTSMRKQVSLAALVGLVTLVIMVIPIGAHEAADIKVSGVWADACDDGTLAVFMTVDNSDAEHPIALMSANSTSVAAVSLAEVDGNCAADAVERVVVPSGEALNFWDSNVALVVEMSEDYEMEAPFTLMLTFDMLEDDLTSNGNQVMVMVGVPVLDEAPAATSLVIDAGSIWARPTVAEMDDMDMGESSDEDSDDMAGMNMGGTSAAYMTIANTSDADDALIAATSNITEIVEIHETSLNENDVMMMRPAEDGIPVPAEGEAVLQPGGFHVMLLDPAPMAPGDTILLTLEFESGETVTIAAPVEDRLMGGMMMDMDMDHGDG
jgi:copper(I)-binding protein